MSDERQALSLEERQNSFKEILQSLSRKEAMEEAKRCLQCQEPKCALGCPAGVNCKQFIHLTAKGKLEEAKRTILLHNSAPCVTGRVCQVQKQCEGSCILAKTGNSINISGLERFVADNTESKHVELPPLNGKKVAIIGAGPAGLAATIDLRHKGYFVVVFEAEKEIGGLLISAIPKYRLPIEIAKRFIDSARTDGVEFHTETRIGDDLLLNDFRKEFDAVLIASGEKIAKQLSIKGTELAGVESWNTFLREFNGKTGKLKGKKMIVIGGGDTAIDCCRVGIRNSADVTLVYRKPESFMPAQKREIEEAKEEGVKFWFQLTPAEFVGDKKLKEAIFEKVLIEKEHLVMSGQFEKLNADLIVVAVGQSQDNEVLMGTELEGQMLKQQEARTKIDKVFVAGDIVNKNKTVIHAIRSGKEAAKEIDDFLMGKSNIPKGVTKI